MKSIKHPLFLSILCSLVLFTNCGDSDDPVADVTTDTTGDTNTDDDSSETVKYDLTVEISPIEGGLVSYQSGPFTEGTKVTLTATANDNYAFKEWTGAFNGTTNPMELIMNADNTVTAVFELLDTDGDGVTDDIDVCSDTPEDETANEVGCSPSQSDSDGDGIFDNLDTCADTPELAEVDENGCADSQKDTDMDGITDDLDTCIDTPEGATVDESGCADSQKDTDMDGITDDLDTCVDTPEGATVDENGCADSQKDTDGDGVTDDLDLCPDTSEGASNISVNGCNIDDVLLFYGSWKLAPIAGALAVGPSKDDLSWYANLIGDATGFRACMFDDVFEFKEDGELKITLDGSTIVDGDDCGEPQAPFDGLGNYTFSGDLSTITVYGQGAYLGWYKVNNEREDLNGKLNNGEYPLSVTYEYEFSTLNVENDLLVLYVTYSGLNGSGGTWRFKMLKI